MILMADSSEVKRGVEKLITEINQLISSLPDDDTTTRALAYSLLHLAQSLNDLI